MVTKAVHLCASGSDFENNSAFFKCALMKEYLLFKNSVIKHTFVKYIRFKVSYTDSLKTYG